MNKNDITDEMLVALADDELPETEAAEVHSIVMEHDDLMRRYSSFVETRFLLQEDAKKKIELSVEAERFIDEQLGLASEDNVVPLASRKKLQPITRARQFIQMAAALAVGVMVGPLAMMTGIFVAPVAVTQAVEEQVIKPPIEAKEQPREALRPVFASTENEKLDAVLIGEAGGTFDSGDSLNLREGFIIKIQSPIPGKLAVYEVHSSGNLEKWPLGKTEITADKIFIFPSKGRLIRLSEPKNLLVLKLMINEGKPDEISRLLIFGHSGGD